MAITINIYYTGVNGNAKQFVEEMHASGIVQAICAEKGNMRYEYFTPLEDEETVLLIDSWDNQAALDMHHSSPMMAEIIRLREKYNLHMKVERYVTDDQEISDHDKSFIKE